MKAKLLLFQVVFLRRSRMSVVTLVCVKSTKLTSTPSECYSGMEMGGEALEAGG